MSYKSTSSTPYTNPAYFNGAINSIHARVALVIFCVLLAGLLLYRSPLTSLIGAVLHREGSSHGVFVPFLSTYFLWMKRDALRDIDPSYDYLGIPLLAGALIPILHIGEYRLQSLSFILLTAGLVTFLLGRELFKVISFPLLFLITMIPLPENIYSTLADYLRDITFGSSSWVISLSGIPFFREGLLFHLPNIVLKVNISCSGIRYLISYFVFSVAYGYLFQRTTKSRITIIASTLPISIAASICRLTVIFLLAYIFGPRTVEYWPHVITSWTIFFIVLVLSIATDQFLHSRKGATRVG